MSAAPKFPSDLDSTSMLSLDRLIGMSDGIFGFSMTLLAVNVDFPHLAADTNAATITDAVVELVPQILVFAFSFLFVALYWQVHRRTFHYIKRNDSLLTWLNILQLMCVAFLPVATGLFDTYGTATSVILLYTGTLALIGVLGIALWGHARRAGLIDENANPILLDYYTFRGRVTTVIYLLAMVAGVLVPLYARVVLLSFLVVYPILSRLYRFLWHWQHKEQA